MSVSSNNSKAPRLVALNAINWVVLEKKSLSSFDFPNTESAALIKSLSFGTLRFYHQLNDIVTQRLKHSLKKTNLDIHCLMLLGAYQILHSNSAPHACIFETVNVVEMLNKGWAKSLVNAILRSIQRDKQQLIQQVHHSHPTWLAKKIKQYYPDHAQQIFAQNNTQAPMTLRIHPSFKSEFLLPTLFSKQLKQGLLLENIPQAYVLNKPINVHEIFQFDQGSCFVQDASAQLAGHLLNPSNTDLILDACCAPGGKTTHLSELAPKSSIIALDNKQKRLARVKENIDRFNIQNVELLYANAQNQDWWDGKMFDKILLDAPCSATGVIRRHPDIKLLRKAKDIATLVALQKQILANLWQMLKPGGTLLYATCSILNSENQEQIANFLAKHQDATEEKITLNWGVEAIHGRQKIPCREFDGFYYAKIIKTQ